MNKTLSINISGFVFNIEEKAYDRLKTYLENVRNNFKNEEERDEIMADIEARIAELFQERIGNTKEVIDNMDISETIDILGHPDDYISEDETEQNNNSSSEQNNQENTNSENVKKRLYRDTDNATVGGICSGLAQYFELDPVVFRISFVLLFVFFGTGILLYIILLLVIPEAKSTSEKIAMKGQSINVESIKEHVSNIKQSINSSGAKSNIKSTVQETVNKSVKVGKSAFQILSKFFGLGLTITGIIFFIFSILILFGDFGILPFIGPDRIPNMTTLIEIIYPGIQPSSLIFISLVVVTLIPIIGAITTGIRLLTNYRQNMKKTSWTMAIIWIIGVSILFVFSVGLASDFKNHKLIKMRIPITDTTANHELFVDVMNDDQFSNYIDPYNGIDNAEQIKVSGESIYIGFINMNIVPLQDSGSFDINLIKRSRGKTDREAIQKIENFDYKIDLINSRLTVSPYLKVPKADKLRGQFLSIEIGVPLGKSIKFGGNTDRIYCRMANQTGDYYENDRYYNHFNTRHFDGDDFHDNYDTYYDGVYFENDYNRFSNSSWTNEMGVMVKKWAN